MTTDQLLAEPQTALPTLRGAVTGLPSYVPGRRSAGADIAALASNESHYEPLPAAITAVAEAAGRMNRYPDMAAVELRERIARHLGVTVEEVAVGPGSVGVLQQIITGLCDAECPGECQGAGFGVLVQGKDDPAVKGIEGAMACDGHIFTRGISS